MSDSTNPSDIFQLRMRLMQCRVSQLVSACKYYCLKRSGTKNDVVERILTFLITATREERHQLSTALDSGNNSPVMDRSRSPPSNGHLTRSSVQSVPVSATAAPVSPPSAEVKSLFASIDPFHPVAPIANPFLYCAPCRHGSANFSLDLPELKALRRQGYSVWLRGISKAAGRNDRQIWPRELRVFINMTQVAKVEEPKKLKKRRDEAIELTMFLQSGRNQIQISTSDSAPSNFTIALIVCGSLSNQSIINSVPSQSVEYCRQRLCEILGVKSDILVEDSVDGLRPLDLRCPISLDRISVPAHGTNCSHIRCFDLNAFVSVNRQTSNMNLRWNCPICQKVIFPKDMIIDSYVKEILDATTDRDVEVLLDVGTADWKRLSQEQEKSRWNPDDSDGRQPEDDEHLYRTEGGGDAIEAKTEELVVVDLSDGDEDGNGDQSDGEVSNDDTVDEFVLPVEKRHKVETPTSTEVIDLD